MVLCHAPDGWTLVANRHFGSPTNSTLGGATTWSIGSVGCCMESGGIGSMARVVLRQWVFDERFLIIISRVLERSNVLDNWDWRGSHCRRNVW